LRMPNPDDLRIRREHRFDDGAAHGGLSVGDEHLAELRITAGLAHDGVVCHVGRVLLRQRDEHGLACLVQGGRHAHARWRYSTVAMNGDDEVWSYVEPHEPGRPGSALAEIELLAVTDCRTRQEFARAIRLAPTQRP
jgi:hypothetical protein